MNFKEAYKELVKGERIYQKGLKLLLGNEYKKVEYLTIVTPSLMEKGTVISSDPFFFGAMDVDKNLHKITDRAVLDLSVYDDDDWKLYDNKRGRKRGSKIK
jgi:hypothetical protein